MGVGDEWREKYYGKWRMLWEDPNKECLPLESIQLRVLRDCSDAPWTIELHVSESYLSSTRVYQTKSGARRAAIRWGIKLMSDDIVTLRKLLP